MLGEKFRRLMPCAYWKNSPERMLIRNPKVRCFGCAARLSGLVMTIKLLAASVVAPTALGSAEWVKCPCNIRMRKMKQGISKLGISVVIIRCMVMYSYDLGKIIR